MKRAAALLLSVFAAGVLSGCDKDVSPNLNNPPEIKVPAAPFSLVVCDKQQGKDSLYSYYADITADSPDGKVRFNRAECNGNTWTFQEDEQILIQTPWNTISFEADKDINASSEDSCLDIERDDPRHYTIKYLSEGSSVIKFWNGAEENVISIRLQAKQSIRIEGFEIRLDGKSYFLQEQNVRTSSVNWNTCRFATLLPIACKSTVWDEIEFGDKGLELIDKVSDTSRGMVLELVGTVPRNATPDNSLYRRMDPIGQSMTATIQKYDNGYPPFDIWNRKNWPAYRWLPKGSTDISAIYAGYCYTACNPADIRYRKTWIWNQNAYRGGLSSIDEYFGFFFNDSGAERNFWGAIGGAPQEP